MKVYKVELMAVDLEGVGQSALESTLENCSDFFYVKAFTFEDRDVIWTDDHPLNFRNKQREEFERLFKA